MKKILGIFFIIIFFSGCADTPLVKKSRLLLGTTVEIAVADKDKSRQFINKTIDEAFMEIERIESLLSRFESGSDIDRINTCAYVQPTKVSPETINLLEKAIEFSRLTDGAFDVTVYPLEEIWGFRGKHKKYIPAPELLREALDNVGYKKLNIVKQEHSVFLTRAGMSLDLGGIAKGYAVDRAIDLLRKKGIKGAMVNAGGDIYCLGGRTKTKKWQVAVQHPREKESILTVLELEDKAVATSGDYQKYTEIDGERYSHIINPASGYPCKDVPASVTVLAEDCLTADALATSLFVLGPDKGIDLINRLNNTEAIAVNVKKNKLDILLSQGLRNKLRFNQ